MRTNLYFISFILLYFINAGHCQDEGYIPSFTGGTNLLSIKSDQVEGKSKPGIGIGATLTGVQNDKLSFITEVSFFHKSSIISGKEYNFSSSSFETGTVDFNLRMNTFNWSFLMNYYLKSPYIAVQVGPLLGLNISPSIDPESDFIYLGKSNDFNETVNANVLQSNIKGVEYALAIGLSGGSEEVKLNVRYYLGFKDYLKNINGGSYPYNIKLNYLTFSITYTFVNVRIKFR